MLGPSLAFDEHDRPSTGPLQKGWLNGYHQEVLEKIGPHVEGEVLEWLEKAVKSI